MRGVWKDELAQQTKAEIIVPCRRIYARACVCVAVLVVCVFSSTNWFPVGHLHVATHKVECARGGSRRAKQRETDVIIGLT